jgi:hypothetical protein
LLSGRRGGGTPVRGPVHAGRGATRRLPTQAWSSRGRGARAGWPPIASPGEPSCCARGEVRVADARAHERDQAAGRRATIRRWRLAHWLKGSGGTAGFDAFTAPARTPNSSPCRRRGAYRSGDRRLRGLVDRVEPPAEDEDAPLARAG